MIFINEWLPNPVGADAAGEWVELYNSGGAAVNIRGWSVRVERGKRFVIGNAGIPARGYLLLPRAVTKLSLRNTDGGVALYDAAGRLVDRGHFDGAAPEGRSFSRMDYATGAVQHFAFADPTPGAANNMAKNTIAVREYPTGVPLNPGFTIAEFSAIMMGTAVLLTALIIYVIKTNEGLQELVFGEN